MKRLSAYQREGLKYMLSSRNPALFWKMRLRKSLVVIRFIKIRNAFPVLIFAPNATIWEWYDQLINDDISTEDIIMLTGAKIKRKELLQNGAGKYFIINHEGHRPLPGIGNYPFVCVVLDESHQIRNCTTQLSRFCTKNFRNVDYRIALSGTWIAETEADIFQQLLYLDKNYTEPYTNYWDFRIKCFDQFGFNWELKPSGRRWITEKLKKHCSILEDADVGIKERLNEITRYVSLDKKVMQQYSDLLHKMILEDNFIQKSTVFSCVTYAWIRQLLSGFVEDRLLNKAKLNDLDYLLKTDLKNQQVIIWTCYTEETVSISKYLNCPYINGQVKNKERDEIRKAFNGKEFRNIVINCKCYTHGANFSPADAEVYLTIPEAALVFNQSRERIFDVDERRLKPCIYIVTKDTIDEKIMYAHKMKLDCRLTVYNYFKRIRDGLSIKHIDG